jgi:branched-chain amino acid transport system permease protein
MNIFSLIVAIVTILLIVGVGFFYLKRAQSRAQKIMAIIVSLLGLSYLYALFLGGLNTFQTRDLISSGGMLAVVFSLYFFLKTESVKGRWIVAGGALGVLALLYGGAALSGVEVPSLLSYLVRTMFVFGGLYGLAMLGLNLQWGYTGLFNIGIHGFIALGAYTSTLLVKASDITLGAEHLAETPIPALGLPFIVGLIGAILVAGLFALLTGISTLRLREDYLAIATIGLAEIIRVAAQNLWFTGKTRGIADIPSPLFDWIVKSSQEDPLGFVDPNYYFWFYAGLIMVALMVVYFAFQRIARSPWGRVLKAIREDEDAANALGKNSFKFKLQSLVLGAMVMGAVGSFWAHVARSITPDAFDAVQWTFLPWVMLIIGGSGNHKGALVGAFLIWALYSITNFQNDFLPQRIAINIDWGFFKWQDSLDIAGRFFGPIRIMIIAIVLELILIYRPRGLLGEEKQVSTLVKH